MEENSVDKQLTLDPIEVETVPVEDVPRTYWLPGPVYTALKWVVLIAIPAVGVAYSALAGIWDLPLADEVSQTCNVVALFGGALIGVSAAKGALTK